MVAFACLCFLLTGCQYQQVHLPPESQPESQPKIEKNRLVYRINQYYKALQSRDYAKTQLFKANRRPQRPAEQTSLAAKLSFQLASYEIQSIHLNKKDAQVIMQVTVTGLDNKYEMVMVDRWQYLGDNWFVVDSTQSSSDDSVQSMDQQMRQNRITW